MLQAPAWVHALSDPWWPEMYAFAMDFWLTLSYLNDSSDGDWGAYNLYNGQEMAFRFGSLQRAYPVAPGLIVLLCRNPWYPLKFWVQESKTITELNETTFGFVHSCVFDQDRDAWQVAIVANLNSAETLWEHPVWGIAYVEIQRVEWYCQQFGPVVPYALGEEAASVLSNFKASDEDRLHAFVLWLQHTDTSCSWSETATIGKHDVDVGVLPLLDIGKTRGWVSSTCCNAWVCAPAAVALLATAVYWCKEHGLK